MESTASGKQRVARRQHAANRQQCQQAFSQQARREISDFGRQKHRLPNGLLTSQVRHIRRRQGKPVQEVTAGFALD
jgi:hypothetical protein